MTEAGVTDFIKTVQETPLRDLPWRRPEVGGSFNPYKIWISEIMLQQTQVPRVIPKYEQFLAAFPTIERLAAATFSDVLAVWNGLGYNRRAKFILDTAKVVASTMSGVLPRTVQELQTLPGIGHNTAAAICVYAYNLPEVFIETNIRTVYIHHFFNDQTGIEDKQLIPLLELTIDQRNPRRWYWRLMDYGTQLKARHGNISRRSRHYVKQTAFHGSRRQLRATVLRLLLDGGTTLNQMKQLFNDERLTVVLADLQKEGLIIKKNQYYQLA